MRLITLAAALSLLTLSAVHAQAVPHGRYYAGTLLCDDGYRNVRGQCEALPTVTNGRYYMATLLCDDGYRSVGGRCEGLPPVTNGHYYMATLLCDDGYRNVGGRCEGLPAVTNGRYYMATLLCDNGYRSVGGQCDRLAPVANGQYAGEVLICNDGFVFANRSCQTYVGAAPVLRIDPVLIARSRRASAADLEDVLTPGAPYRSAGAPVAGSTLDPRSGNSYRWVRSADGTTNVQGLNVNTGSSWQTKIKTDGSMSGVDSQLNPWRYDAGTSVYINYGTGKMCVGKGAARTCF